jgi:ribosomal subunit interface protein
MRVAGVDRVEPDMSGPAGGEPTSGTPPVVVHGRHTVVPERFRVHATEKLRCVAKFDHKIIRLEVEVSSENNPRRAHDCERVQITCLSRGPVVRAEAAAQDAYAALDLAVAKLEERLRRAADRRHSRGARISRLPQTRVDPAPLPVGAAAEPESPAVDGLLEGAEDGPFLVREKVHAAATMTLDEALANMELVGHDFYLFRDVSCGTPSVVYRRRGYHYGVLRLGADAAESSEDPAATIGRPHSQRAQASQET